MDTRGQEPSTVRGTRENAAYYADGRHPGVHDALQWLAFFHLPENLRKFSRPFYDAAVALLDEVRTDSPELTTALNKLVEAKDSAMRAGIKADTGRAGPVPRPNMVVEPPLFGTGNATAAGPGSVANTGVIRNR